MKTDDELRLEELQYAAESGDRENFDSDEILFLLKLVKRKDDAVSRRRTDMMNPNQAAFVIRANAVMCEMEGMKAENQQRAFEGRSPAYAEDAFFILVRALDNLAHELVNCP